MRLLTFCCSLLLVSIGNAVPTQPQNDTGQILCYDTDGGSITCSQPAYSGQDGQYGRDIAAEHGVLPKAGGGMSGFDFTKVANKGGDLPEEASLGNDPEDWACTRDNHTGLLWEIKLAQSSSPRYHGWFFQWYSEDWEHNGGEPGFPSGPSPECGFTMDCNTQAYVDHINGLELCGRNDWRLPSAEEALGIINFGIDNPVGGALDEVYFADGDWHVIWTADPAHEPPHKSAWSVIYDGRIEGAPKGNGHQIRLVSGTQHENGGERPECRGEENPHIRSNTAGTFTVEEEVAHDARTGLTWARCALGQHLEGGNDGHCEGAAEAFSWQQALQAVRDRNTEHYLGHEDWRLPNLKELLSIKELSCMMPMLDARTFPQDVMESFWTSTSAPGYPTHAWGVAFELGHHVDWTKTVGSPHVMLVRGGGPFADYHGDLTYSVGGTVSGMLGGGLVLSLDAGGAAESLSIGGNGDFVFNSGLDEGTSYSVTVSQAPVPFQACVVNNGEGTIGTADITSVAVVCAEPDSSTIEVDPGSLSFVASGATGAELHISNSGGGILHWSVNTAYAAAGMPARGGIDCESAPGIIIQDDGTVENRYSGNPAWSGGVMVVDHFTPDSYPASISSVCLGLARSGGASSMSFEIVVFADNGPGGMPGTELGALAVSADDLPVYPVSEPHWFSYDISSLYTTIDFGGVYVGMRWQPSNPGLFPLADESEDRPVGFAGGYYWNYSGAGQWSPLQDVAADYRAMFIRPVQAGPQAPPVGCDNPNAVPWLNVQPATGQTNSGDTSAVQVTVAPAGLTPGDYHALLCIGSDDPDNSLEEVSIHLLVEAPPEPVMQPRNDTGLTICHDVDGDEIPCSRPGYPGQDGHYGRDAAATDGVLPKVGGGSGGFDFTKIANDGSPLPEDASLGANPGDWACTEDNITGLLWEIKINQPPSPRHYQWLYSWYSDDHDHNGGDPGWPAGPGLGCNYTLDCNTQAYIDHINGLALCGRSDWRLPTLTELQDIVNFGSSFHTGGAMDRVYFADGGGYSGWAGGWTVDTAHEPSPEMAWALNFDDGHAEPAPKGGLMPIRLVAGELNETEGEMPFCMGMENPQIRPSTAAAFTTDDQLVHDARTNLIWTRCPLGQHLAGGDGEGGHCEGGPETFNWQQALQAVKARNAEHYLGHDDWRLPSMKELVSLLERRCAQPMLDGIAFPQPPMEPFWTSTTRTYAPNSAYAIGFEFGHQLGMLKTTVLPHVMMVRSGGPFDDYRGPMAYSVGGQLSSMLGEALALRLEAGGEVEVLEVNDNGAFVFVSGLDEGTAYTVTVEQPPVPFQDCTVSNGTGTIGTADVSNVAVVCAAPEPPVIEVSPMSLDLTVMETTTLSTGLTIDNTGGGILHWSLETAYAAAGMPAGGGIDCEAQPGIIIHDDGTVESAYTGNPAWSGGVMIVDRFTPENYPASIASVCLSFAGAAGATTLDFEIVVFADNGPSGAPGTELGALPVSASGIPAYPPAVPQWFSYDISSLFTTIDSGSVYVGVRWQPSTPQVYLLADETDDRPAGYAGGYFWHGGLGDGGQWVLLQQQFAQYRAMFIRAVEAGPQLPPAGCDNPNAVPWLQVVTASGQTNAGDSSFAEVTVDPVGLALGEYSALLCVGSNDAGNPLVEVPVALTVIEYMDPPVIDVVPDGLSSSLLPGDAETHALQVSNHGEADLTWWVQEETDSGHVARVAGPATIPASGRAGGNGGDGAGFARASGASAAAVTRPLQPPARGEVTLSHSAAMTIQAGNSVACANEGPPQTTLDNQFLRTFTLTDFDIEDDFEVTAVTFGVESMVGATGVTLDVNLYTLDGAFNYANLTLIGTAATTVASGTELELVTVPISADVPAGATLVVELAVPSLISMGRFFPGSNSLGETAPSYLASDTCNTPNPVTFSTIGAGHVRLVMSVTGAVAGPGCELPEWVSVTPTSGTVAGGMQQMVDVTLSAAGLAPGEYVAGLCLGSNDPERPVTSVPLNLLVEDPGSAELAFTPPSLAFGEVMIGTAGPAQAATLSNSGNLDATGLSFDSSGGGFSVDTGACGATLTAGTSCEVMVTFAPETLGATAGTMTVSGDAGVTAVLDFSGTGVAPVDAVFHDRFEDQ